MNDMSPVCEPKSDQLNSDDLLSGPQSFTIESVEIRPGTEQPVSIWLKNHPRPWKPCKSMSRCLVALWGPDAKIYVGRSMTLYRDPTVKWGGMEIGGIRLSHMSHIDHEHTLALTASKGSRKPFKVLPLAVSAPVSATPSEALIEAGMAAAKLGSAELGKWWKSISKDDRTAMAAIKDADLKPLAQAADEAAAASAEKF